MSTLPGNLMRGTAAARPASASPGAIYFATDTQITSRWSGSAWQSWGVAALVGDSGAGGTAGFAPAPAAGDAAAGKFLKADNTWAIPAGGSAGALVLLLSRTASASASLDFTSVITSTYDEYLIELVNLVPATDNVELNLRMSTNNGSSYDSGANYTNAGIAYRSGVNAGNGATGSTAIKLLGNAVTHSNVTARGGISGSFRLFNPLSTAHNKHIIGQLWLPAADGNFYGVTAGGSYVSTTAVDAFQILESSGNITSGFARLYGIAKT
jgi:hypothetical protein